jgi:hypothetical protein
LESVPFFPRVGVVEFAFQGGRGVMPYTFKINGQSKTVDVPRERNDETTDPTT